MVVHGEIDGEGRGAHSCQLSCSQHPMVAVGSQSLAEGKPEQDEHRGQRPPHYPQPGMTLPDVVKESGGDDVTVGDPGGNNQEGGVVAVTLVGVPLGEEDPTGLG